MIALKNYAYGGFHPSRAAVGHSGVRTTMRLLSHLELESKSCAIYVFFSDNRLKYRLEMQPAHPETPYQKV